MAKIRVHELAKELGIPSKDMVLILQNLGLNVKNHMSTMEDSQANWVRNRLKNDTIKTVDSPVEVPKPQQSVPKPQPPQPAAPKEPVDKDQTSKKARKPVGVIKDKTIGKEQDKASGPVNAHMR